MYINKNKDKVKMHSVIDIEDSPKVTHIHLNRPKALNAMSASLLLEALEAIQSTVKPIVFTGEGRSFCAGGDVVSMAKKKVSARYLLNLVGSLFYSISILPQQTTAVLDGLALGGGLSWSMACKSRIITNNTVIGIPETSIGFVPDVGVSYYLNKIPHRELGLYLSLTGATLKGPECIFAGFSNIFIPELLPHIKNELVSEGIEPVLCNSQQPDSNQSEILKILPLISQCFDVNFDVETICNRLSSVNTAWSMHTLNHLHKMCPLSLKLAHECFRRGASMDYYDVIEMEHNVSVKSIEMENSNFYIGIFHKLINKEKKRPNWVPNSLCEISDGLVQELFRDYSYKLINYKI